MSASSHQPRFHGSQIHSQNFRNFFVTKTFNVAQDDYGAEGLGHLNQLLLNPGADFFMRGEFEGGLMLVDQRVFESYWMAFALSFELGLDGDFLLLMTAPPAFLIGGFVDGDAIYPG